VRRFFARGEIDIVSKRILMVGTFDTKGAEYALLRECILARGHDVLALNVGVLASTGLFPVDIEADTVAAAAGESIEKLRKDRDRGAAMRVMHDGAATLVQSLHARTPFDGIIGMGGGGGTSVITSAMRALPLGVPKVCLTTMISGDVASYVGEKDIVLMPSVVDIAGLNRISRLMIARAAAAICGMVESAPLPSGGDKPIIAATVFGNTTECVNACRDQLSALGCEVVSFHATGSGGRAMESLVDEGWFAAVLDVTTTEWADEVAGGILSAGPHRLEAPGRAGIPHVIAPGCIDMVNFGAPHTVPSRYRDAGRSFHQWNPDVTLIRTNVEENKRMGRIFAEKANAAKGPVAFLLPLRGFSILGGPGGPFHDPAADRAMMDELKRHLRQDIPVLELDCNINDPEFAAKAVAMLMEMLRKKKGMQ
jgi:uncharacterized protein (UPF0261 family)